MTTSTATKTVLTPKRAAQLLVRDWLLRASSDPRIMYTDEMNMQLQGWGYNVTDKRREEIIRQVDLVLQPLMNKLDDDVQKFGAII